MRIRDQLSIEREISARYHLPGTGPSGASHKWYRTLISRSTLTTICLSLSVACVIGCGNKPAETIQPESRVEIVPDQSPSDEAKASMLAAKEALFTQLSTRLMEAISTQGPQHAIAVCQKEAPKIAESVSQEHGLRIGRTGVRLRNTKNTAPSWATTMIDQRVEEPTFVSLDNGGSAALLPIKLQGQCLMCHGPEEQIAPVISQQIAKLYPDDRATGFREGDLRGWFWIELPAS
jgi:hypothetical protein